MSDVWQEMLRVRGYLVLKETNGGTFLKPILAERDHITPECDSHKSRSVSTQVRGALDVRADAYSATLEQLAGTYQESCPLGVLELCTFKQLTSICALGSS